MTQAAHTPGPWYVTPYKTSIGVTSRPDGGYAHRIAECDYWNPAGNGQPDREAAEANARLIASAPDLLETLRKIAGGNVEGLGDSLLQGNATSAVFILQSIANAAIAKALGEQS